MTDPPNFAWPYVRRIEGLTGHTVDPLSIWQAWREIEELPTAAIAPRIRVAAHNGRHAVEEAQRESYRLEYKMLTHEAAERRNGKVPPHMQPGWDDGEDLRTICSDIKQRISVREFIERETGQSVAKNGKTLCPVHKETNPSCYVYEDRYYCFGCQAKGDVIDLAVTVWGYSKPIEAIRRLQQWT